MCVCLSLAVKWRCWTVLAACPRRWLARTRTDSYPRWLGSNCSLRSLDSDWHAHRWRGVLLWKSGREWWEHFLAGASWPFFRCVKNRVFAERWDAILDTCEKRTTLRSHISGTVRTKNLFDVSFSSLCLFLSIRCKTTPEKWFFLPFP